MASGPVAEENSKTLVSLRKDWLQQKGSECAKRNCAEASFWHKLTVNEWSKMRCLSSSSSSLWCLFQGLLPLQPTGWSPAVLPKSCLKCSDFTAVCWSRLSSSHQLCYRPCLLWHKESHTQLESSSVSQCSSHLPRRKPSHVEQTTLMLCPGIPFGLIL